jgi:GNAT superfamily N-acetyltransferase
MNMSPAIKGRVAYDYSLHFDGVPDPLQVGLVVGEESGEEGFKLLRWTSEDFFVPPSLWGGGLGSSFMAALLHKGSAMALQHINTVEVFVVSRYQERSAMYREDRISFVEFYRSAGFTTVASGTTDAPLELRTLLRNPKELDAWTQMRWSRPDG